MNSYKRLTNIAGWLVFAVAAIVFFMSAERTGSLWDCGEFVLGAYKLQVVHPPGAPLFLIVGRMFTYFAELFSDTAANPENIAFAVNLMSGICTAFGAMFICWVTMIFGKLSLMSREETPTQGQSYALAGAGIIAGLAMAFCSSVWFSAVEGEVYAMSTFFTCLTFWAMAKWYHLPNTGNSDRWLIFAVYAAGLSIGIHLLSLLTFPTLAILYYYKKFENHTFKGTVLAAAIGMVSFVGVQKLIITGIPNLWKTMELFMVNDLGMPFHSGIFPTLLIIGGIFATLLMYFHGKLQSKVPLYVWGAILAIVFIGSIPDVFNSEGRAESKMGAAFFRVLILLGSGFAIYYFGIAKREFRHVAQIMTIGAMMVVISFSTIGVVVIRANANTPINMNAPSDPMRLLPYLNREQYGERPLLYGPNFSKAGDPDDNTIEERYGQVTKDKNGNPVKEYAVVDEKVSYVYNKDKVFFPRMGDHTQGRPDKYRNWINKPSGNPTFLDNVHYTFKYQLGWMYWRYFMWNFAGRQNGEQGFYEWDKKSGHWESGIKFIDEARLYNMDELPETMKRHRARNHYYLLPFIFGLIGLWFHLKRNTNDAVALLAMFIITGIGIIIYSNQPPNEPRERDYVLVGSFFTFCIWIGMAALAIFEMLREKAKVAGPMAAIVGTLVVLSAPVIMGTENFDDNTRAHHTGARDYASNFLESCEPNAIIFTYGDNDTYPLWYAQEVEKIRTDVRVVNLSLIAVDWYINQLTRKVNDSAPIKMTISGDAYRGRNRNTVPFVNPNRDGPEREMTVHQLLNFIGADNPLPARGGREFASFMPSRNVYLPINKPKAYETGALTAKDTVGVVDRIPIKLSGKSYLMKDELAVLDVIASNIWDRPVYFAVTCRPDKMFGLDDYMQLEGLGLRIVPVKTKSEQGLYVYGNGRVSVDHVYDNVMNKFRWGNFDGEETFIDRSYGPSIQSHRVIIMRAARAANRQGEKQKAIDLVEKYLQSFPNHNFPFDFNTWQVLKVMLDAGGYEQAKPYLETLAAETLDHLEFYNSLESRHLDRETGSFGSDYEFSMGTQMALKRAAKENGDTAFEQDLVKMFENFDITTLQGPN